MAEPNDLEYDDLNDRQREKVDAASAALGGGRDRSRRQPRLGKRQRRTESMRWVSGLGYVDNQGKLYRGTDDGRVQLMRELPDDIKRTLRESTGSSRTWDAVRSHYGIERGENGGRR